MFFSAKSLYSCAAAFMQLDKFEDFPSLADINSLESSKKSKTNATAKTTDSSTQSVATKSVGTQKRDCNFIS